jgi:Ca-activated chloride channel homolog
MTLRIGLAAALQLVAVMQLIAQTAEMRPISVRKLPAEVFKTPVIRADSDLVLVPVLVVDHAGTAVNGLAADAFTVFEDKTPQNIVSFGNEDVPCSLGVILDLSGSMSAKLNVAANALRSFLDLANPEDEAMLLTVSTRPESISEFTQDFGLLQNRLRAASAGGATALIDSVYMGLNRMRAARRPHKALLVISDGMDNHSRYSTPELLRVAEEADVQIYTITIQTQALTKKPIELTEERNGQVFMQTLADRTGGLNWTIRDYNEAPPIAAKLSQAIREQYLIGYRPVVNNDSGKWRTIQVKVSLPRAHIASRVGYYSH